MARSQKIKITQNRLLVHIVDMKMVTVGKLTMMKTSVSVLAVAVCFHISGM